MTEPEVERPFEALLEELEQVVRKLEQGQLPLADSLSAFERGMQLAATADTRLTEAEARVEVLVKGPDGSPQAVPLTALHPEADPGPDPT